MVGCLIRGKNYRLRQGERSPAFIEQLVTEAIPKASANPEELVELQFEVMTHVSDVLQWYPSALFD
jgi:hypothetical protein